MNCGSTHIEGLSEFVKAHDYEVGFAFDGDADRLLCVDEDGTVVDGDQIMAIASKYYKTKNKLNSNTLVGTVMSNLGLRKFCENEGINFEATKVGDRYVLERMLEKGYSIGGEQSGHIIFLDHATTGDGELSAVMVLNIMRETGKSLKELAKEIDIYPQILKNVKVSAFGKLRLNEDEDIKIAIKKAEEELGDEGRVLVRASGTEPLIRVMLEGKDLEKIDRLSDMIADVVKDKLL